MARLNESDSWGPDEVGRLRVAWVAEPPRLDGPVRLAAYDPDYRLVIREPDWHEHRLLKGPDTDINLHVVPLGS